MRAGHVVALCVIALLTIGVLMVSSAGMRIGAVDGPNDEIAPITVQSIVFSRITVYMLLAIGAMSFAAFFPIRRLASLVNLGPDTAMRLFGIGCVLMVILCGLVYVPGLSRQMNGSHRWIGLPIPGLGDALSVQPSEIAKWGMVILLALYCAARANVIESFWRGLVPALVGIGAVAGFIVLADLGTGFLIALVACLLLLASGARVRYFAMFVPVGVVGIVGAIITSPYRVKRILAFMDPYADSQGIGYHTIQSLLAIANGGGFGRGLGHGLQKFGYLPENKTDFLFANICEELGIAGAALVIGLFGILVWSGFAIMRRERDSMLRLVAMGIIATVGLQAVINLAVVTGLAPTKGIALPLLSSGGTGWILTAFSLGLLIAIDRTQVEDVAVESLGSGLGVEVKSEPVAAPVMAAVPVAAGVTA